MVKSVTKGNFVFFLLGCFCEGCVHGRSHSRKMLSPSKRSSAAPAREPLGNSHLLMLAIRAIYGARHTTMLFVHLYFQYLRSYDTVSMSYPRARSGNSAEFPEWRPQSLLLGRKPSLILMPMLRHHSHRLILCLARYSRLVRHSRLFQWKRSKSSSLETRYISCKLQLIEFWQLWANGSVC